MGERLNIEILKGDKLLANSYYHWSGFTSSSIVLTKNIIGFLKNFEFGEDEVLDSIKILESSGAGMTEEEINLSSYDKSLFKKCEGRNNGLINISEEGMDETRYWEEERVQIDIKNNKVNFGSLRIFNNPKDINEYIVDYGGLDNIEIFDLNLKDSFSFEEFKIFGDTILNLIEDKIYKVRNEEGSLIVIFIE